MEKDSEDIVLGEGSLQLQDEKIFLENFQIALINPPPTFGKLCCRFFLQNTILIFSKESSFSTGAGFPEV